MGKVLIVDDDIAIVESLKYAFKNKYNLLMAYNATDAVKLYKSNDVAVSILDLKLGAEDGMELYYKIKEINPEAVVVIITAYGTIKSSIEAIKSGIFHYLTKPIDISELEFIISKGMEMYNLYKRLNELNEITRQKYYDHGIIANSYKMKSVLTTVEKIKDIDSNVLITGESGTGKGLIARAIHDMGNRKNEKFHVVNCAAIPNELLESELFGYKKGAFTGAIRDRKGFFELSNNGTLFLDEIGDLDISLQGKLLHAIQDKKIVPIGSEDEINIDVRIITATNRDLLSLMNEGGFREDLYYRLNVINIHMPALRERREDIPSLINHFIYKYSRLLNKNINKIEDEFVKILESYSYKGNIRELENIIERAIALSEKGILSSNDLKIFNSNENERESDYGKKLIPIFVGESLHDIEKRVILTTYEMYNKNQKVTSEILSISDRTIRNKLKQYEESEE